MALSAATLHSALMAFGEHPNHPKSVQEAMQKWADAYNTYASAAMDFSGDPLLSGKTAAFQSALSFNLNNTAQIAAQNYDNALVAYWAGATFNVAIPHPLLSVEATSIAVATPGALAPLLLPIFSNLDKNAKATDRLMDIANAIHTATVAAVLVTISGTSKTMPPVPLVVPPTPIS